MIRGVFGWLTRRVAAVGRPVGDGRRRGTIGPALGLLLVVLAVSGARAAHQYRPLTYLIGDCPYYALVAVSLLHDGDLDLRNQLRGGLEVHGRQIALGDDGAWYPKHPILMSIVSLPFLWAFGVPGLLAFNVLVLALLAVAIMLLARSESSPMAAAGAALLIVFGTFLREYEYNFSPDLFATLILVLALLLAIRGRSAAGGAFLGAAVAAKLTHLFIVPIVLGYAAWSRGWRAAGRTMLGAAPFLLALALLNVALFGSPFETSYDRNVVLDGGDVLTLSHRGLFDGDPLAGLFAELFDPKHGLLTTAPVVLLALPGFVLLFRRRPLEAALYLVIGEFLLLFFGTYRHWNTSHYGNRFLMPVLAVCAPAVAMALEWIVLRLRTPRSARREAPAAPAP